MMNLVVDYGNTTAKVGIFEEHELTQKHTFKTAEALKTFLGSTAATYALISSVQIDADTIASWSRSDHAALILNPALPLPIHNQYATPETLGQDRVADVCGAIQLFPGQHSLVIDAGSCITYDLVDASKNFVGGAISPGLAMRFRAVHNFTARLPLLQAADHPPLIGTNTTGCIQSGVVNGLLAEIDGIIAQYQERYEKLQVIVCGGDTEFLKRHLKSTVQAVPDLGLLGLHTILNYNIAR